MNAVHHPPKRQLLKIVHFKIDNWFLLDVRVERFLRTKLGTWQVVRKNCFRTPIPKFHFLTWCRASVPRAWPNYCSRLFIIGHIKIYLIGSIICSARIRKTPIVLYSITHSTLHSYKAELGRFVTVYNNQNYIINQYIYVHIILLIKLYCFIQHFPAYCPQNTNPVQDTFFAFSYTVIFSRKRLYRNFIFLKNSHRKLYRKFQLA